MQRLTINLSQCVQAVFNHFGSSTYLVSFGLFSLFKCDDDLLWDLYIVVSKFLR